MYCFYSLKIPLFKNNITTETLSGSLQHYQGKAVTMAEGTLPENLKQRELDMRRHLSRDLDSEPQSMDTALCRSKEGKKPLCSQVGSSC